MKGTLMSAVEHYIQMRTNTWYVANSGVQALGVISMWHQGYAPEEIQFSYPSLSLMEVYGAILYYLEHREQMDASFREQEANFQQIKATAEARDPGFAAELRARVANFRDVHQHSSASAAS